MRYKIITAIVTLSFIFNLSNGQNDSITFKISGINTNNAENSFFINSSWFLNNNSIRIANQPGSSFSKEFKLPSDNPMLFELYAHTIAKGLAFPGDTVYISFNLGKELTPDISITGKTGSICRYYTNALKQCFSYNYSFSDAKADNYLKYFSVIETEYNCKNKYFEEYKNSAASIPANYLAYEKVNLIYEKHTQMLKLIHEINFRNTKKLYANPEMLLWFRDVPIDNPKALQVHSYYQFLFHYFLWKSKIFWYIGANRKIQAEWLPAILTDVRKELSGITRDWFLTKTLINLYHTNDYIEVDKVFSLCSNDIINKESLTEIQTAREFSVEVKRQYLANAAGVGSRAPDFNLRNEQNKLVSLKELSGQWSLLCFYNNKFLNRTDSLIYNVPKATSMLGDTLRTVFIYTEPELENNNRVLPYSTADVWLQAKGFWAESIIKKYGVEMFPYFVLIDPEGIIRYSKATDFSGALMFFSNK